MKSIAVFTGFVLLTTSIAVPLFFFRKRQAARQLRDDNIRYDIDDYMAAESL